jgi:streptogramin lyase
VDGAGGAVVPDIDGNLSGASFQGGTGKCGSLGCGTIFRVTPSTGAYEVVFNFPGSTDEFPISFIAAADGSFFGLDSGPQGQSLFHFTPSTGAFQSVALNFPVFNGGLPSVGESLALGPNGNFFGIYHIYGESGLGLFEVKTDGSNLQLFPFYTTVNGGGTPDGLLLASDGNFWVADFNGGGHGNIITLSPSTGTVTQTITTFGRKFPAVGSFPAVLIQAKDGTLWGTTDQGGIASTGHFADGTVFSLSVGLPPK